jgi:F0F1-type ATP synthase assembly protein I
MFPAPCRDRGPVVAENGDSKRPEPPSPDQYERLKREAEALRQSKLSGRSDDAARRRTLQSGMHAYMRYTGIGLQFVIALLLPVGLGYWLDSKLGTSPWLLVAGAVLGAIGAMVWVVRTVLRMERRDAGRKTH